MDGKHLDFTWSVKSGWNATARLAMATSLKPNHYRYYCSRQENLVVAVFSCYGKDEKCHTVFRVSNAYTLPPISMKLYGTPLLSFSRRRTHSG